MKYYNELVEMLMTHADGMRVGMIARALYNANCDLFDTLSSVRFKLIYETVQRYLWQQSRLSNSPFKRVKWGTYALRRHFVHQLELVFDEWEDDGPVHRPEEKAKTQEPKMLNLFGW